MLSLPALLPLVTALLALPFAALVVARWRTKHRPYLLLWATGIATFGLGAAAEAIFQLIGWHALLFRVYYLCGAILTAAWLGQGTIQLLGKRPWSQIGLVGLSVLSLYGAFEVGRAELQPAFMSDRIGVVQGLNGTSAGEALRLAGTAVAPSPVAVGDVWARALADKAGVTTAPSTEPERLDQGLRRNGVAVGTQQMLDALGIATPPSSVAGTPLFIVRGDTVIGVASLLPARELNGSAILRTTSNARSITPIFNVYGTLGLAGGAIYSAWIFLRKRALYDRMIGNILIATGALAPALGGTLSKAGFPYAVEVSNLLGIVVIFAGFVQATRTDSPTAAVRPASGTTTAVKSKYRASTRRELGRGRVTGLRLVVSGLAVVFVVVVLLAFLATTGEITLR
ncbi:MAG: hypothetical protein H0X37_20845 [Herpetosiphonaceae bacterium]|nr:hypothetical protein [Herpetosiphonaceae bacterium]